MKYVEKNIRHEEGSVLEPCIRRCPDDETTTRAMEPRNGFILENWEIPRSHGGIGTPLRHSPATYLTHKLTTFRAIEIDMGLCQKLDTIPASVDENDETLKNFYTSLGPALPIATLQ